MGRARGAFEAWRCEAVERLLALPAEAVVQGIGEALDGIEATLAGEERREPVVEIGEEGFVGERVETGVACADAERPGALGPGEQGEAVGADRLKQSRLDLDGIGVGVGARGEADAAEAASHQASPSFTISSADWGSARSRSAAAASAVSLPLAKSGSPRCQSFLTSA